MVKPTVFLIALNLLYALFFFTREYEPVITVNTQIEVNNPTTVWYVYKTKYSEERLFSKRFKIGKNKKQKIPFVINTEEELDYLGLFWNSKKGSSIKLRSFQYTINGKTYKETAAREIIHYTSLGSLTRSDSDGIMVTSTNSDRNWIIYNDAHVINEKRDVKTYAPMPLLYNLFAFVMGLLFFYSNRNILENYELGFSMDLQGVKSSLLGIWVFLMPFWIIVSHTLLGIICAISIYQLITSKEVYAKAKKQVYLGAVFLALYASAIISMLLSRRFTETLDTSLDYIYLALMPLCLIGVSKHHKKIILNIFKLGLLVYLGLLSVFAIQNFITQNPDYNFIRFFELNLELFWHTSYFSFMILIAFISDVRKKLNLISLEFFSWLGALLLMYLLNARLPFLVGIMILALRIYYSLSTNWQRQLLIVLTSIIVASSFSYFLLKTDQNNTGDINSMDARWSIWSASLDQIEENIWFGVGNQNTIEAISTSVDDKFRTKYRNYNAHNQFIEMFLSFGLITFVVFMLSLGLYYKNSTFYGRVFIIAASILFLVESYLQRQAGMVLFTFWLFFFYNYNGKGIQKYI